MNNCGICLELRNQNNSEGSNLKNLTDKNFIIYSNDLFSIVPSIGALNESHVLLVPNRHIKNFSALSREEKECLLVILDKIEEYYLDKFQSKVVFFEHGTGRISKKNCIEHAHIHCVIEHEAVLPFFLKNLELTKVDNSFFIPNNDLEYFTSESGYIWLKSHVGEWIGTDLNIKSQELRYLYKTSIGETDWDWRIHKKIQVVDKVISNFENFHKRIPSI